MSVENHILKHFNAMVANKTFTINLENIHNGYITDFIPTDHQKNVLNKTFKPININTLFTVEERENNDISELIKKQLLHYIETYGLSMDGSLTTEVNGTIITMKYIQSISIKELHTKITNILYSNKPFSECKDIKEIIEHYCLDYDFYKIQNNEMRIQLYRNDDMFDSGDDAVRYLVYKSSGSSLLIKNNQTFSDLKKHFQTNDYNDFLKKHIISLSKVFNRHKDLFMNMKQENNKKVINYISKKSKKLHVPIIEGINKTFINQYLIGNVDKTILSKISVRDKLKYLDTLEWKLYEGSSDCYHIRNGKIFTKEIIKKYDRKKVQQCIDDVLESLSHNLSCLHVKNILLDEKVDYGLPVSKKKTIGNVPFGTTVKVNSAKISSGIYWENAWGANDLDLSTVDALGNRTGWGSYSGYDKSNPITYSGDVTNAPNGAMEFMTSKKQSYGLYVNVYRGEIGTKCKVVVGDASTTKWIKNVSFEEMLTFNSNSNIVGYVVGNEYIAYQGRLGSSRISAGTNVNNIIFNKITKTSYTIKKLFDKLGIEYDVIDSGKNYDYDLSYKSISYDKIEELFDI